MPAASVRAMRADIRQYPTPMLPAPERRHKRWSPTPREWAQRSDTGEAAAQPTMERRHARRRADARQKGAPRPRLPIGASSLEGGVPGGDTLHVDGVHLRPVLFRHGELPYRAVAGSVVVISPAVSQDPGRQAGLAYGCRAGWARASTRRSDAEVTPLASASVRRPWGSTGYESRRPGGRSTGRSRTGGTTRAARAR